MANIVIDGKQYDSLIKKYKSAEKDIEKFIISRCHYYTKIFNSPSQKYPEVMERYGFEEGKKLEWFDKIKEFITLVDLEYKPTLSQEDIDKKIKKGNNKEELEEKDVNNEYFFTKHTEGKNEGKIKSFIPKLMADFILDKYSFKVIKGNDKQIYYYLKGYYKENGVALIRGIVTKILGNLFKEYYVNETISYIKNINYIGSEEINKKWINLKNGLLNPITKEIKEHNPDIFSLNQLPIEYDSNATCDFFKEHLKKRCDKKWKYQLIKEMFGYCLLGDNRFEKSFLFYGERRTMKSTTLHILEKLLGIENVTSMSLQQITEDKHAPAFLLNSIANICAELSPKELRNTNMFMKIVGRDTITAGKKFEQEITFSPTTKLIFSCNSIPSTTNKNLAFYRRWCVIEFNIQTEEKDIDPLMRDKFLEELPGILNWALEGLENILKNNKLKYPLNDEETKDLYEKGSDSIQSFIFNCIDCEDDEGSEKKRVIYKEYSKYCKNNKLDIENQILFGRRFIAITGCGTKRIDQIPGYAGISIKIKNREEFAKKDEKSEFFNKMKKLNL